MQSAKSQVIALTETAASFIIDPLLVKNYPVIQSYFEQLVKTMNW